MITYDNEEKKFKKLNPSNFLVSQQVFGYLEFFIESMIFRY